MIELRVLGPLEAVVDGRPAALPVGKPSAVLARLALDANRVVPIEALVDALWGSAPPASAHKVLQAYVSQLRKAVGPDRIATRPPGYVLRVERDELDLARFEQLTEAARSAASPREAAELLGRALALWRGPALAEFRAEPFAVAAGRRLAELRLAALERRAEAELALGRHDELVPGLEALVAQEPLREPLRASLMLALYRSGRQADALATYREGRRLLVDELGLEPGSRLQSLERAILRHDPQLDEPRPEPRAAQRTVVAGGARLAPLLAPLCADGRELILVEIATRTDELAALARRLDSARASLGSNGGAAVRTACFTAARPADELARFAAEQDAELVALDGLPGPDELDRLASAAAADVAVVARPELELSPDGPVLAPFGGGRDEWAALELAAWLARAHGLPLHLLGAEASGDRRDASRMLAKASLVLQRVAGTAAEPVLVEPGPDGVLAQRGSAIVASLPPGPLEPTRAALVERATVPVVLVRGGYRPGGLAPGGTLTRFSWSLRDEPAR